MPSPSLLAARIELIKMHLEPPHLVRSGAHDQIANTAHEHDMWVQTTLVRDESGQPVAMTIAPEVHSSGIRVEPLLRAVIDLEGVSGIILIHWQNIATDRPLLEPIGNDHDFRRLLTSWNGDGFEPAKHPVWTEKITPRLEAYAREHESD